MTALADSGTLTPRDTQNMRTMFKGQHWGLVPALLSLPLLVLHPVVGAGPERDFLLLALLMASYDIASFRIPNILNLVAALAGMIWATALGGLPGLGEAVLGGLVGFGLMAVFFFLGSVGAGDVKALGALGVFLGPWGAVELFVLTTLCGGVLAAIRIAWFARGDGNWMLAMRSGLKMPYGLAILGGSMLMIILGGGVL